MRARHPPRLWLMTDERLGDELWAALARLPRGSGIVFRHYATPPGNRRHMFAMVLRIARRRGLIVVRAGEMPLRGEAGVHNRAERARGLRTYAVHNARELAAAGRRRADVVFVSPVFATQSHPTARGLGVVRLGLLLRKTKVATIALGGMNEQAFGRLRGLGLWGWAGIDAWRDPAAN